MTAKRTNRVLQEMGTDCQLLKSVTKRKLGYFGHTTYMRIYRENSNCLSNA